MIGAIKTTAIVATIVYLGLAVEYGDNCTRYRAPWCGFLDASFALVGL